MCKHVDLIAVGVLLVAFAFALRIHNVLQGGLGEARFWRGRALNPVIIEPPRLPAVPRAPRLPRVQY